MSLNRHIDLIVKVKTGLGPNRWKDLLLYVAVCADRSFKPQQDKLVRGGRATALIAAALHMIDVLPLSLENHFPWGILSK